VKELDALGGASAHLQGRSWDDLFDDFDHVSDNVWQEHCGFTLTVPIVVSRYN
jgi:hypothetical protein